MQSTYLFQSQRLGFRNWVSADIPKMTAISADPKVMEHFPATATEIQTIEFVERMQKMFNNKGYCYFAVDRFDTGEFIGFIGLCYQTYEAPFTPCVDIGWRLATEHWGLGFATEGARSCLEYGFNVLKIEAIKSIAVIQNIKSIRVMQKIGMEKELHFKHPALIGTHLEDCVCYGKLRSNLEN